LEQKRQYVRHFFGGNNLKSLHRCPGPDPPSGWIGRIDGISYKLGGEFLSTSSFKRVRLTVNNVLKTVDVSNVVGVVKGPI
jgi:hypothetical protein